LKPAGSLLARDARRWLPGVLISLLALYLVFRLASGEDLAVAFGALRWPNVLACVGLTVLFLFVRALAWRTLLRGKPTVRQTFLAINMGYLVNNLLPRRMGEIARAIFLGRLTGINPLQVLSTVVIERAFDMAIAAGLLLATLPLALGLEGSTTITWIVLAVVLAGLAVLFLVARNHAWTHRLIDRIGERFPWFERFLARHIKAGVTGLTALADGRLFLSSLALILLSWLVAVSQYYIMLIQFVPRAPFWWAAFIDGALALGIAVPSAPGSLGVFEAAIVGALAVLGVSRSAGLAYAITVHLIQYVITAIFGVYALVKEGQSFGDLIGQIRLRRETGVESSK
jgi:uncharacterized protein (TIRG00374 family)